MGTLAACALLVLYIHIKKECCMSYKLNKSSSQTQLKTENKTF